MSNDIRDQINERMGQLGWSVYRLSKELGGKVPGIHLGDVCAYALRRCLDRGALVGSHEEKQF